MKRLLTVIPLILMVMLVNSSNISTIIELNPTEGVSFHIEEYDPSTAAYHIEQFNSSSVAYHIEDLPSSSVLFHVELMKGAAGSVFRYSQYSFLYH